jgi:hypothetical protein
MRNTKLEDVVLGTTAILAMVLAGTALVSLANFIAAVVPLLESTMAARMLR